MLFHLLINSASDRRGRAINAADVSLTVYQLSDVPQIVVSPKKNGFFIGS